MVNIILTKKFIKNYKALIARNPSLKLKVIKRTELFRRNPYHNSLHSHKLTGTMSDTFSFSITGDIRIVYYWEQGSVIFVDIGTHSYIYK